MTAIELLHPHTHAGTVHPAGAVLSVSADPADLSPREAEWLIAMGAARPAAKAPAKNPLPASDPAAD